jgi:hypothetical protein
MQVFDDRSQAESGWNCSFDDRFQAESGWNCSFDDRFQAESGWNFCLETVIKNLHET